MKTNKIVILLIVTSLIFTTGFNSVSAKYGQGQGGGNQMTEEERAEIQAMSDEEREEYRNQKMEENGGNGEGKNEQGKGNQMTEEERTEIQAMSDEEREEYRNQKMEENSEYKSEHEIKSNKLKEKIGQNADAVNGLMIKFTNKYKNLSIDEQKAKLENLILKVDEALVKIENYNLSDSKKEAYLNIFEYVKAQSILAIDELDSVIDEEDIDFESLFND